MTDPSSLDEDPRWGSALGVLLLGNVLAGLAGAVALFWPLPHWGIDGRMILGLGGGPAILLVAFVAALKAGSPPRTVTGNPTSRHSLVAGVVAVTALLLGWFGAGFLAMASSGDLGGACLLGLLIPQILALIVFFQVRGRLAASAPPTPPVAEITPPRESAAGTLFRRLPARSTVTVAMALLTVFSGIAFLVAGVGEHSLHGGASLEALLVPLLLGMTIALDRLTHKDETPNIAVAASFGALLMAPALCWSSVACLQFKLSYWATIGPSPSWFALLIPGVLGVPVFAFLLASVRPTRLTGVSRAVAAATTLGLSVLVLLSAIRSANHQSLDRYFEEMEANSVRTPLRNARWMVPSPTPTRQMPSSPPGTMPGREHYRGPRGTLRERAGSLTVIEQCDEGGCRLALVHGNEGAPPDDLFVAAPALETSDSIAVRYQPHAHVALLADCCASKVEFEEHDGQLRPSPFDPRRLPGRMSSAPVTTLEGALGLLIAVGLWVRWWRATRPLGKARSGTLGEDGWIAFENGQTARVDGLPGTPPGPVVVFSDPGKDSPYRDGDMVSPKDIVAGTLADVQRRAALRALRRDMVITAITCLAAAPLVAAAITGLLGPT